MIGRSHNTAMAGSVTEGIALHATTSEIDTALSRRGVMHGLGSCRLTWKGGMFDGVAGGCWEQGRGGMKGNAYDACTLQATMAADFRSIHSTYVGRN
jgi:hypothetical protein